MKEERRSACGPAALSRRERKARAASAWGWGPKRCLGEEARSRPASVKKSRLTATILVVVLCLFALAAQQPARPSRIISLIPAVTEMLFAIGAGPQVVAVSSFDRYPAAVETLPRVGALLDPDLEKILALR